jgi:hypothetical protein
MVPLVMHADRDFRAIACYWDCNRVKCANGHLPGCMKR